MMKILHVIDGLTLGGAGRSLLALVQHAPNDRAFEERVISLRPVSGAARAHAEKVGLRLVATPSRETIVHEVTASDLVHVHFWNTPELYELFRSDLPAMRLLVWLKIFGEHAPQVLTEELLTYADLTVGTSPATCRLPAVTNFIRDGGADRIEVVPGIADFTRLAGYRARPHDTYNVGYVGTVDHVKMHPSFVAMSARVRVPEARFIVCGTGDAIPSLRTQAVAVGLGERLELLGHVEDVKAVLERFDVFGYPLCRDTYATSEKSLQEAMIVGIPPVVFPYGGVGDIVRDGHTGLVVHSETEYTEAIEYLYHDEEARSRLGRNAAAEARVAFDAVRSVEKMHRLYERLLQRPKRMRTWPPMRRGPSPRPRADSKWFPGAAAFAESLGAAATPFLASLCGDDVETVFEAEREIACASPLLRSAHSGGLFHYRRYYPEDGFLHFWSGLVLKGMGRPALALAELQKAITLGCDHWRVSLHLAEAASAAGAETLAQRARKDVERVAGVVQGTGPTS